MAFRREKVLEAAQRYATRGQHDKAAREYVAIVEDDPTDIRSCLLLADCLVRAGRREEAIERYKQVAAHYSDDKQYEKALAVYRQITNLDAERIDVHLRCGELYRALRQLPDAIQSFELAAHSALRQGDVQTAMSLYVGVVELAPDVVAKRLRLAELYSREQMIDAAVEQFGICAEQLLENGLHPQYIRVAERLLFHRDTADDVLIELIRVYLATDQPRRALVKLNGFLQRKPASPEGLELLGETFVALGKHDKAVSVIMELVRERSTAGPTGRRVAERALRRALEWMPDQRDLAMALRRLVEEREQGREPEAQADIEELSGLAEIDPTQTIELDEDDIQSGRDDLDGDLTEDDQRALDAIHEVDEPEDTYDLGDEDLIEELAVDDLEIEDEDEHEEAAAGDSPEPPIDLMRSPSFPAAALEIESSPLLEEMREHAVSGFDRQSWLSEGAALIKYRLFDHARAHISALIERDANDIDALELRADLWAALGREGEAASLRVALAQRHANSNPGRACRLLEAALATEPEDAAGLALATQLGMRPTPESKSPLDGDPTSTMEIDPGDSAIMEFDDSDLFSVDAEQVRAAAAATARSAPTIAMERSPVADDDFAQRQAAVLDARVPEVSVTDTIELDIEEDDLEIAIETVEEDDSANEDTVLVESRFDLPGGDEGIEDRFGLDDDDGVEDRFGLGEAESEIESSSSRETGEPELPATDSAFAVEEFTEPEFGTQPSDVAAEEQWSEAHDSAASSQPAGERMPGDELTSDSALDVALAQALGREQKEQREQEASASEVESAEMAVDAEPPADEVDLSEDLSEIDFYLEQGLVEDARFVFEDLSGRFPGHSKLLALASKFEDSDASEVANADDGAIDESSSSADGSPELAESASSEQDDFVDPLAGLFEDEADDTAPTSTATVGAEAVQAEVAAAIEDGQADSGGAEQAAEPTVELGSSSDDEDAYLSTIFGDGGGAEFDEALSGAVEVAGANQDAHSSAATGSVGFRASSDIGDGDAGTHFDLGMGYREMGLMDSAFAEFEAASQDPAWKARALVMMASVQSYRGESDQAITSLNAAVEVASTRDELSQAHYELGVIYEALGDKTSAATHYAEAGQDFRDAAERVDRLG